MAYSAEFKLAMEKIAERIPVAEITKRTGLHRSTVYQWLSGNAPRDARKIVEFGRKLGLSEYTQEALLSAVGVPNRIYDFDDKDDAPEAEPLYIDVTQPDYSERSGALLAARDFWLEERRHAVQVLDHVMRRCLSHHRDYLEWCARHHLEPEFPDPRPALLLALSYSDLEDIDTAIDASFESLRARVADVAGSQRKGEAPDASDGEHVPDGAGS